MATQKKQIDVCKLADGTGIKEIAWYGEGAHKDLKNEMGAYWFNKLILERFATTYNERKVIAVIDYKYGDSTLQLHGIGNTPEKATASALREFLYKNEQAVKSARKVLDKLEK